MVYIAMPAFPVYLEDKVTCSGVDRPKHRGLGPYMAWAHPTSGLVAGANVQRDANKTRVKPLNSHVNGIYIK